MHTARLEMYVFQFQMQSLDVAPRGQVSPPDATSRRGWVSQVPCLSHGAHDIPSPHVNRHAPVETSLSHNFVGGR